jgi:putative membrane protein
MYKFLSVIALALVLIGCPSREETATTETSATAATSTAEAAPAPLSASDGQWVQNAARGGMAEVQLSENVGERGANAEVRQFSQLMIADHNSANAELTHIVTGRNVELPADLDAEHKTLDEELAKLRGAALDKKYMEALVKDHRKAVADFQAGTTSLQDPAVRDFAIKTLPKLQEHLQMAEALAAKVGVKV